jgi:DNA-directed RNA polymerase specialized sigma24 family protein
MRCGGSASGALPRTSAAQTFAVAWRRLDALPADPLPWLLGVARRVIQTRLVQRGEQATVDSIHTRP